MTAAAGEPTTTGPDADIPSSCAQAAATLATAPTSATTAPATTTTPTRATSTSNGSVSTAAAAGDRDDDHADGVSACVNALHAEGEHGIGQIVSEYAHDRNEARAGTPNARHDDDDDSAPAAAHGRAEHGHHSVP